MVKKIFFAISLMLASIAIAHAQNQDDGLLFSRSTHLGTARFTAMGGAFTALGGDATTLAYNPAGIGVYRSSEFTFTGNLLYANTKANYMGNSAEDNRYRFGLSNLALIGAHQTYNETGLVSFNFGFAYNKTTNFGQRYLVNGNFQSSNTYLDYFAQRGTNDAVLPDDLNDESWMAYDTYLINYDTAYNDYYPSLSNGDETRASQYADITGYLSTYDFSIGGNVSNVFYFGMTISISSVEYSEDNVSSEYGALSNQSDFRSFDYTKRYRKDGIGYNFKFGAIICPFANADILNGLRIGAAIHTRTFLNMDDWYESSISSRLGGDRYDAWINPNEFHYKLETPMRVMAGLSYVFTPEAGNWRGILSADYEYVDYSKIQLREKSGYLTNSYFDPHFSVSNANIANSFKSTHNLRFGGELGYQNISFRLGYAHYDNPYTGNVGKDGTVNIYSGGVGLQVTNSFNLNFAYSLSSRKDKQYMYYTLAGNNGGVDIISDEQSHTIRQSNFFVTCGWRF